MKENVIVMDSPLRCTISCSRGSNIKQHTYNTAQKQSHTTYMRLLHTNQPTHQSPHIHPIHCFIITCRWVTPTSFHTFSFVVAYAVFAGNVDIVTLECCFGDWVRLLAYGQIKTQGRKGKESVVVHIAACQPKQDNNFPDQHIS